MLTGCQASVESPAPEAPSSDQPAPAAEAPPQDEPVTDGTQEYASVARLREAVERAGVGCSGYVEHSRDLAQCNDWTMLELFDLADREWRISKHEELLELDPDANLLVGANWAVNGDRADLELLRGELGGVLYGRSS